MNYSLKAKCQGCYALKCTDGAFSCDMGVPIATEQGSKPSPYETKCYKPKSLKEYREATKLLKAKINA